MQESIGIILRVYKEKPHTITVLDQTLGRIELYRSTSKQNPALAGGLITYQHYQRFNKFFTDNTKLLALPEEIITHHLLFLHHILEIIALFMPVGNAADGLFDLLQHLYAHAPNKWTTNTLLQKIFLCKIVLLLGMNDAIHNILLQSAAPYLAMPIDIVDPESLHLTDEQQITMWLQRCLEDHQPLAQFKTANFYSYKKGN